MLSSKQVTSHSFLTRNNCAGFTRKKELVTTCTAYCITDALYKECSIKQKSENHYFTKEIKYRMKANDLGMGPRAPTLILKEILIQRHVHTTSMTIFILERLRADEARVAYLVKD